MSLRRSSCNRSIVARTSALPAGRGASGSAGAGASRPAAGAGSAAGVGRRAVQVVDANEPVLAGEGQGAVAGLLLRDPGDGVLSGVVDRHPATDVDREPAGRREDGVAQVVLGAGRGGRAEPLRPPGAGGAAGDEEADAGRAARRLRLRLGLRPGRGRGQRGRAAQQPGELGAERVDPGLERVVEHVPDHDHAALRPLAHAAELGMAELRLAAAAGDERRQQRARGIGRDAVAIGDLRHAAGGFRGKLGHRGPPCRKVTSKSRRLRRRFRRRSGRRSGWSAARRRPAPTGRSSRSCPCRGRAPCRCRWRGCGGARWRRRRSASHP